MITCVCCNCGASDLLIRGALKESGYGDAVGVSVVKGKDKSISMLNSIPQHSGINDLISYVRNASKYAIAVGFDEYNLRWVDVANGQAVKNRVDLELLVEHFA